MFFAPILCAALFIPPAPRPSPDPIAEMVAHFPSDAVAVAQITFGKAHAKWVEDRIAGGLVADCREEWKAYLSDVRCRIRLWEVVLEVRQHVGKDMWGSDGCDLSEADRMERIGWIISELGAENYARGWLPLVVDVRRVRIGE